ncbi:MAG TPA: CHRD domain-containing protein [Blastocatellia bacterium]|nr:CHRD domain-containing protein [Blastocatellia bacterium]
MKKQLSNVSVVIGVLFALSAFSVSAHDRDNKFHAKLVGAQEVPVVSTQGSGDFEARIEPDGSLSFKLSYENLEGAATPPVVPLFAHIHLGQKSVNGGVMVFLCGGGGKPACPASPATVEGTITAADIIALGSQQIPAGADGLNELIRGLRNGTTYANVHTPVSPTGEIRGQIKVDDGRHHGHDHGWW